jgi:hypothetical protein
MTDERDRRVSKRVFLRTAGLGALTTLLVPAVRDVVHAQAAAGPSPAAGPGPHTQSAGVPAHPSPDGGPDASQNTLVVSVTAPRPSMRSARTTHDPGW